MSRSRKKYPIMWLCGSSAAMKKWKKESNKRIRHCDDVPSGKHYKKINDIWSSPSDGKIWRKGYKRAERK